MKKTLILSIIALASLWVCAPGAMAQTQRGDFDYDGHTNINDLTALIEYLLDGQWDATPWVVRDTLTVGGVSFVMVHVDGGTISLGEGITGTVPSFCIGQTEVTQALWKAVMGNNPSYYQAYTDLPVEQVSWDDCQAFIQELNALTGLNFRLPRSLEWTFAASGGNHGRGFTYAGSDSQLLVAWHDANTNGTNPQRTKQLKPNELGLYDMSGNVNEWCSDVSQSNTGSRIIRGGDYHYGAYHCTVSWVGDTKQGTRSRLNGLRLALTL